MFARIVLSLAAGLLCMPLAGPAAHAAEPTHYSFGYDQPHTTGYGIVGDTFAAKLLALSNGAMVVDQFPGAQLGQEPQMLQKLRTGDIDFAVTSTANSATLSPEAGVMSLHYLFRSEAHLRHAIASPAVSMAMRKLFDDTVQGVHALALCTLGLRDLYGKREVHRVEDLKGMKVRVQATATEDAFFAAYGAQTVHMPFGSVYTSLQTGVMDFAENGINVYQANKHYEVAPIMSLTEHEANNSIVWISDKLWRSLSPEQQGWVQQAADEVAKTQPDQAFALEHKSLASLQKLGVKFVTDVDKSGFEKIAIPLQDKLAAGLGPHAVEVLKLVRAVQ